MEIKDFIEKFCDAVEVENPETVNADTDFHSLDEWSSLAALSIIAMVDDEYDVVIKGDDIRNSDTIEDLFNAVKSKAE